MKPKNSLILFLALVSIPFFFDSESKVFKEVKSGERILMCYIGNTEKIIDPDKVKSELDNHWEFTNGYAKNCRTVHKSEILEMNRG